MKELCALYRRVSTDNQADHGVSLPAQESRLVAYCKAQGWEVYQVYTDDGYSGKDLDRPAMKQLLKDAKSGKFSHVAVIKLDRISRSQKDALYLIEDVFNANQIGFHSVTESFDTTTPFGKAALGMMSVFAQLEREMIVERILGAKKESAKQGRFMGGFVPYGYKHDRAAKKLVIDTTTAPIVQYIYTTYLTGQYGFQTIADMLNAKKIPTALNSANGWDKSNIRKMLMTPYYVGKIPHLGEAYPSTHEAIVTQEQFDIAQQMIAKRYVPRPVKNDDNLLTGFIYCGECGARMRYRTLKRSNGKIDSHYMCYTAHGRKSMSTLDKCHNGYKRVDVINKAVINYVLSVACDSDALDRLIDEAVKGSYNITDIDEQENLKAELVKIQKKLDRWYDAFEDGGIDSEQLSNRIQSLRTKQIDIQSRLNSIETTIENSSKKIVTVETIRSLFNNLPLIWEETTPTERRAILSDIIDKVNVSNDGSVNVQLAF